MTINPVGGRLFANTGSIALTCALSTTCRGTLTLGRPGALTASKKARKPVIYGRGTFSIRAGYTRNIAIRLYAAARKLLRGRTFLRVAATAKVGTQSVTTTVTLKRAGKHAKK